MMMKRVEDASSYWTTAFYQFHLFSSLWLHLALVIGIRILIIFTHTPWVERALLETMKRATHTQGSSSEQSVCSLRRHKSRLMATTTRTNYRILATTLGARHGPFAFYCDDIMIIRQSPHSCVCHIEEKKQKTSNFFFFSRCYKSRVGTWWCAVWKFPPTVELCSAMIDQSKCRRTGTRTWNSSIMKTRTSWWCDEVDWKELSHNK